MSTTSSKCSSSDQSDISDILYSEKLRIVERKREQLVIFPEDEELMIGPDRSYHSRAKLGISQLSIPLAWNLDQHFKLKGESRTYSMFVTLQTKSNVIDSKLVTNIDRTVTDVVFPESFVFQNEPDDFCVEVSLYAARTDGGSHDHSGSIRHRITRSLGRRFGAHVKNQLSVADSKSFAPESIGNTHFNLLARCLLVLTDAHERCQIHDLKVSAFADLSGPPLYGNLLCRLVCLPNSVSKSMADGVLTVRPTHNERVYQHVRGRLQAGVLRCFINNDLHLSPSAEQTLLRIVVTPGSRVIPSDLPEAFILMLEPSVDQPMLQYFISCDTAQAANAWIDALEAQITDTAIWGEFAYMHSQLTFEHRKDPIETINRTTGARLYDTININGTIGKTFAAHNSYAPTTNGALKLSTYSAGSPVKNSPIKRNKIRTNVKDIFKDVDDAVSDCNFRPTRYVINLNVGEGTSPLKPVDSRPRIQVNDAENDCPNPTSPTSQGTTYALPSNLSSSPLFRRSPVALRQTESESGIILGGQSLPRSHTKNPVFRKSWSKGLGTIFQKTLMTPDVQITRL